MVSLKDQKTGDCPDDMRIVRGSLIATFVLVVLVSAAIPRAAFAQTDEIQVYDAEIEEPGKLNVEVHNNFTPIGRKTPDFPGAIIADRSDNGAVEWAYGLTSWMEQGLYFPVYTAYSKNYGGTLDGFKIRELFVRPHAHDHTFFYGVNFEFSVNYHYWEDKHITSEVRPIIGLHLHPIDIIFNPIMDTNYTHGLAGLEFVPAGRLAYNINSAWAVAGEWYSDFGTFHEFMPRPEQFQEVWAVFDHQGKKLNIESGVGVGVTPGSDKLTLKLMLSGDIAEFHLTR
jgi:hypothetical protein